MTAYVEQGFWGSKDRGKPIGKVLPNNGLAFWSDEQEQKMPLIAPNGTRKQLPATIHIFGAEDGFQYVLPTQTGVTTLATLPESNPRCIVGYHPKFGGVKVWSTPKDGWSDESYEPITVEDIVGVIEFHLK